LDEWNQVNQKEERRSSRRRKNNYTHRNRQVYIPDEHLAVGLIVGVHGLRGEVKVELHTDFPERFSTGAIVNLGEELIQAEIASARMHKAHMLVRFAGINRREEAEALRGEWIFIHEDDAKKLDDGAYWIHDLVGLQVRSTEGQICGEIVDVLATGANDVYLVRTQAPFNRGRDLLLPAIADVVQSVDIDAGEMVVVLPAGLVEE
jgi:16S rRNA processing protein RimM